jgi:acyl-CoA thioesterase FadM
VERAGERLLSARVRVACVDQTHFKPRRLPPELLSQLIPSS